MTYGAYRSDGNKSVTEAFSIGGPESGLSFTCVGGFEQCGINWPNGAKDVSYTFGHKTCAQRGFDLDMPTRKIVDANFRRARLRINTFADFKNESGQPIFSYMPNSVDLFTNYDIPFTSLIGKTWYILAPAGLCFQCDKGSQPCQTMTTKETAVFPLTFVQLPYNYNQTLNNPAVAVLPVNNTFPGLVPPNVHLLY